MLKCRVLVAIAPFSHFFRFAKPAGLILSVLVVIVYTIALQFEGYVSIMTETKTEQQQQQLCHVKKE